jgi:hypothetical protein
MFCLGLKGIWLDLARDLKFKALASVSGVPICDSEPVLYTVPDLDIIEPLLLQALPLKYSSAFTVFRFFKHCVACFRSVCYFYGSGLDLDMRAQYRLWS